MRIGNEIGADDRNKQKT
jgi:hypothetical protein